jgi:hypothetical protein
MSGHKQSHQWTDRAALPVNWRLSDRVRCRGQKVISKVRSRDWFRIGPAVAFELGPDSGEDEQGPVVIQCKLNDILFAGLRVWLRCIFGEAVGRDQAAAFHTSASRASTGDVVLRYSSQGNRRHEAAACPSAS